MSIKEIRVCNGYECEKFTRDYIQDGWILIGEGGLIKYKGRNKDRAALTEVYINDEADFCSWDCLKSTVNK